MMSALGTLFHLIASNGPFNGALSIGKQAVVANFNIPAQHVPEETRGQLTGPIFEPGTSKTKNRRANHTSRNLLLSFELQITDMKTMQTF
jgi:hypothetical protein